MVQLNRHEFPNGGWAFRQPQTNWTNPMALVGFDASVKAIIKHRMANRAITVKHGLATDPMAVANELENYTRTRLGIPLDTGPSFFQRSRSLFPEGAAAVVGDSWIRRITRTKTGVVTLADWLGTDGKPVASGLAEERASICATCPQNKKGDLISFFVKPVADLIRKQLEERKELKLSTSKDADLNVCDACGCPIKLKVHVPLRFIKSHIKSPEFNKLDPRCWILKEQE